MTKPNAFTIYNASAGSGKTFTLVKAYLKLLFKANNLLAFRNILALTFTNKAVNEMKERIIETLKQFSEAQILESQNSMFSAIVEELPIEPNTLHQKSKVILNTIVHNYAAFDISTIDKFNHKLIRTFAYDLNLSLNFDVEIDAQMVLNKAVDRLIDKAGIDEMLTKVLVDFAIEKTDDDKSWDIAYDFRDIAKLLISDNDAPFIETIKDKTLYDFSELKILLNKKIKTSEKKTVEVAQQTLNLISENGLQFEDFTRSYLPKYFKSLVDKNFNINFNTKWQEDIEHKTLYPKTKANSGIALTIERIQPQLAASFYNTKQHVFHLNFLKNCLKNITPLSVLNAINTTLTELKDEENIVLISEFNTIISKQIKNQPAPFIYERIGEKFKHYFIDEFQDTSVMQWENLVPLISNALSGENLKGETGSTLLVGDAKQAIYRWRGGRAEQFIGLYNNDNPFFIDKSVQNLPTNYRSLQEIVMFNNAFFQHISTFSFLNEDHQSIYQNSTQHTHLQSQGYVELSFSDIKTDDKNTLHCDKVLETIYNAIDNGFEFSDICIITRRTKEGIVIAEFLSSQNVPIISSQSLLLKNAPEINFISNMITLATQPKNDELKVNILSFLSNNVLKIEDEHHFYSALVHLDAHALFKGLQLYDIHFNFNTFLQLPLYEAVETIVRQFHFNANPNAYIQFYLDTVLEFTQKSDSSFSAFIDHWEQKKDALSVVFPEGNNAVQIMTIHKSKGLEFPVVIFPYANQNIYFDLIPKVWFPVDEKQYNGFNWLHINYNKDLEHLNPIGKKIHTHYQSQLELDSINLLYVVLTRAVEQLYIISEYDLDRNQNEKHNYYSGLFISYLKSINLWNNEQTTYSFGTLNRALAKTLKKQSIIPTQFISTSKESHNLKIVTNSAYLWNTAQQTAIEKGNLIHNIMSQIKTKDDIDYVFEQFIFSGKLDSNQRNTLQPIVYDIINHEQLTNYFSPNLTIYNERDIITASGHILRPDRVVVDSSKNVIIIDYKTGSRNEMHKQQLQTYQHALESMNYKVVKKILVYISIPVSVEVY